MLAPRIACLVAALLLTASVSLFAQEEPPVAPGDRVRVTAPTIEPDRLVGTVMEIGADTCVLEVEGRADTLALPLASVTKLEVNWGSESNAARGAGLGLLAGGFVGVAFGAAFCSGDRCETSGASVGQAALFFGGFGAGVGLVIGAGIGQVSRRDLWRTVDLQSVRVGLTPHGRRGLAVSVSLRL
jgi:hypothetical protein